MKKTIAFATAALMVLLLAASFVYAATPEQPSQGRHYQPPTLTDAQKEELAPLYNQMLETQKQIMQKYVEWGYITQWQADQRAAVMQDRMNHRLQQGFIGFGMMGRGHGHGHGPGPDGRGPGFGAGPCQQQAPSANQ